MTAIEELRAQRDFLADPAHMWVQGSPSKDGECCAIVRKDGGRDVILIIDTYDAYAFLRQAVGGSAVSTWNDCVATSREDVIDALNRAIALAEAEEGK